MRPGLADLPAAPLPPGCHVAAFTPADRPAWVTVVSAADRLQRVTDATFERSFGPHPSEQPRRILLARNALNEVVGTVAAWFAPAGWGRIHWLAVTPAWQGRGWGQALLGTALARLRELGHQRACLITESGREPALRLYFAAGFLAQPHDAAEQQVWDSLARRGLPVPFAPPGTPPWDSRLEGNCLPGADLRVTAGGRGTTLRPCARAPFNSPPATRRSPWPNRSGTPEG